jgi:hypothetical protein
VQKDEATIPARFWYYYFTRMVQVFYLASMADLSLIITVFVYESCMEKIYRCISLQKPA